MCDVFEYIVKLEDARESRIYGRDVMNPTAKRILDLVRTDFSFKSQPGILNIHSFRSMLWLNSDDVICLGFIVFSKNVLKMDWEKFEIWRHFLVITVWFS